MIQFVGAGPGAEDLITVRGAKLLEQADVVVYAGSLVNPAHLARTKQGCQIYDSASMTLEQVMDVMIPAAQAGKLVVRLHTGDPSIYGAIREQMDVLDEQGIAYDVCPGVSSFCGAAAALHAEYTLPDVSQTVILSRMAGRTPVPERESIRKLASHGSTMVLFLSSGMLGKLARGTDCGRLCTGDTGGDCLQGDVAGSARVPHDDCGTGADRQGQRHFQDRSNYSRRLFGRYL